MVEGSIYRFFVSKRDLLVRVVEHWFVELLTEDAEQFAAVAGTQNRLRYIIFPHLASIRAEPALSRLVFQELRPDADYRNTRLFELNQSYTRRIVDLVRDGAASGEFRSDIPPTLVRDMVFGCIEHRTWAFLRNEGEFDIVSSADDIAGMIHRALRAEPGPEAGGMDAAIARLERIAERLEGAAPEAASDQGRK